MFLFIQAGFAYYEWTDGGFPFRRCGLCRECASSRNSVVFFRRIHLALSLVGGKSCSIYSVPFDNVDPKLSRNQRTLFLYNGGFVGIFLVAWIQMKKLINPSSCYRLSVKDLISDGSPLVVSTLPSSANLELQRRLPNRSPWCSGFQHCTCKAPKVPYRYERE